MAFKLLKAETKEIDAAFAAFTEARDALALALREPADRMSGEYGDKSERWQDGDAASAAQDLIGTLEQLADEIEGFDPDIADFPA